MPLSIRPFKQVIYNTFFRRNSVFVATTFIAAFSFSMGFDLATTAFWDSHNRGVSLLGFLQHGSLREKRKVPGHLPAAGLVCL